MFFVGNSESSLMLKAELMSESLETVITALVIGLTLQHKAHTHYNPILSPEEVICYTD